MGLLDGQTDEYMMSLFIQQQLIIDTHETGHDGIVYTIAENSLSELNINQNDIPLLTLNANSTTINQHLVVEGDTAFDGDFLVTGQVNMASDFTVNGNASINGTLGINGQVNMASGFISVAQSFMYANLDIITSDLSVDTDTFHVNSTTGKVGIGTNAPTKLLHIYSDDVEANLLLESLDDNAVFVLNSNSGGSVASGINRESRIIFQEVGVQKAIMGYDPDDGKFGIKMGIIGSLVPTDFWIADDGSAGFGSDVSITGDLVVNTDVFFVDASSGYIGIGTNTPARELHVKRNAGSGYDFSAAYTGVSQIFESDRDAIFAINSITNSQAEIWFGDTAKINNGRIRYENSTDEFEFWNADRVSMRLDASGDLNVLYNANVSGNAIIGSVGEELEIGNMGFGNWAGLAHTNFANTTGYALLQNKTTGEVLINRPTGQSIKFNENNTAQMTILTGGNVGIGETAPDSLLQVGGGTTNTTRSDVCQLTGNATGSEAICLSLVNDATSTQGNATSMTFHNAFNHSPVGKIMVVATGSTSKSDMIFSTYNSGLQERMRMTYDGKVGIGTSTPSYGLEVAGTAKVTGALTIGSNLITPAITTINTGSYGSVETVTGNGAGGWEGYSINGDWCLMAQTDALVGLYDDTVNKWVWKYDKTNALMKFNVGTGGDLMTIDSSGNVTATGDITAWGSVSCDSIVPTNSGQFVNKYIAGNITYINSSVTGSLKKTILSHTYTPLSSTSKLLITFDANYTITGTQTDSWWSYIEVDGNTITEKSQNLSNAGALRSGVLAPITGVYTNTSTTAKTITFRVKQNLTDDDLNFTVYNTISIEEIEN